MDVTKPYKFIGFGAIDVTKAYKFIGFGAIDVTKPYKFIGFGDTDRLQPGFKPEPKFVYIWGLNGPDRPPNPSYLSFIFLSF